MVHINIQDATNTLPATTGIPYDTQVISPDLTVSNALKAEGEAAFNTGVGILEKQKKASDATYVANQSVQVDEQLRKLSDSLRQSETSPQGHTQSFIEQSQPIIDQALAAAPSPEAKIVLQGQLATLQKSTFQQEDLYEKTAIKNDYIDQHNQSVNILSNELARNPDNFEQVMAQHAQLRDGLSSFLSPQEVRKLDERDKEYLTEAFIGAKINQNPHDAIAILNSGALDTNLNGAQTAAYIADANRSIIARQNAADKAAQAAHEQVLDAIDDKFVDGSMKQADLAKLVKDGTISIEEYNQKSNVYNAYVKNMAIDDGGSAKVSAAISGQIPLDPKSKEDKDAVDTYFTKTFMPSIAGEKDPDKQMSSVLNFVNRVGIVPPALESQLNAQITNGSTSQKVAASKMITSMVTTNPNEAQGFHPEELAQAQKIHNFVSAGLSPDEAVELAAKPGPEKGSTLYTKQVQAFNKTVKFNTSDFQDAIGSSAPANVPQGAQKDWETLYRVYAIDNNMPLKDASKLAYKTLASTWGTTVVTDTPQYMKYPPEQTYGVPGYNNSWIKGQLNNFLDTVSTNKESDSSKKNFSLVVNPATLGSKQPEYMIGHTDPVNGHFSFITDVQGSPLSWRPDITQQPDYKTLVEEGRKAFERTNQMQIQTGHDFKQLRDVPAARDNNIPGTTQDVNGFGF